MSLFAVFTCRYRHDTVLYKDKLFVIAGGNEMETHPLWPVRYLYCEIFVLVEVRQSKGFTIYI